MLRARRTARTGGALGNIEMVGLIEMVKQRIQWSSERILKATKDNKERLCPATAFSASLRFRLSGVFKGPALFLSVNENTVVRRSDADNDYTDPRTASWMEALEG